MNHPCELQAVVVGSDHSVIDSVMPCLEQLGIALSVCAQPASAVQTLKREKIDAFFVDRDLDPELSVLKGMRSSPSNRSAVGFVIAPREAAQAETFRIADFVIEKPVSTASVGRTVRAAYGIMLKERKRYFRHSVGIPVELTDSSYRRFVGQSINISQTGIAVAFATQLGSRETVQLEFHLPNMGEKLSCKAQIIWTAEQGKTGLSFTHMNPVDRQRLTAWIEEEFHRLWEMPAGHAAAVRRNATNSAAPIRNN